WSPLVLAWLLLLFLAARADPLLGLLAVLAFGGAFLAGLVGVGGAIIMIPLLLYVPPAFGLAGLDIKAVAGITMVQVTVAALAALLGHVEGIDRRLFLGIGPTMVVASFAGAFLSGAVEPVVLEAVFAGMATLAALMTLGLRGRTAPEGNAVAVAVPVAAAAGAGVGFMAGLVGAGGAFFLVPVLLYGLRVPVRVTVGTSLAVVAVAAVAGMLGKVVTGQVDWPMALGLIVGAMPGARLGAYVSRQTRTDRLVLVLGVAIGLVAVRMWATILAG
ncbi:MAG TPA: sulfite exporter TauE/SafE family protein, partial [Candidatus Limnocylindrales bacterium]